MYRRKDATGLTGPNKLRSALMGASALAIIVGVSGQGHAVEVEAGGFDIKLDTTLTYSSVFRMQEFDPSAGSIPNENDGNTNFQDRGLVQSLGRVTVDVEGKRRLDNFEIGFFSRALAFIDTEIYESSTDSSDSNNNSVLGGSAEVGEFADAIEDTAARDVRLYDAFVYGNFLENTNTPVNVRVGNQVINWGENLFIQTGIANAINPADVTAANTPGTEVKEILLPTPTASVSVGLGPNLGLQAYYQWEWDRTIPPAHGTYLSTNDFVGDGSSAIIAALTPGGPAFVTRGSDITPDDDGQFGVALRWFAEALNGTDFGFYYVNYHYKLPGFTVTALGPPAPGSFGRYQMEFAEDVELYGFSFNTSLFGTAFSGEVAYHKDIPLQTTGFAAGLGASGAIGGGTPVSINSREDLIVASLYLNRDLNRTPLFRSLGDDVSALVEFGVVHTPDLEDGEVFRGNLPMDQTAHGVRGRLTMVHFDGIGRFITPLSGTDLIVAVPFGLDLNGSSAINAGSFTENNKSLGINLTGSYQGAIEGTIGYNMFWDGSLEDRDFLSATLKYRF